MAFATLSRYEIVPFAAVIAAGIAFVILTTWERSDRGRSLESGLVLYLAPVVYFGVAWLFFNWLILGDPLYFLSFGATTADLATSQQDVGGLEARALGPSDDRRLPGEAQLRALPAHPGRRCGARRHGVRQAVVDVAGARGLLATNAVVTGLLFLRTVDPNLLQLRYNMRAMPIAMMGVAWLYWIWNARSARAVIWTATIAILVVSLAMTWRTMETYTYQYEENVFLRALETGDDQEGNTGIGGYPIGIAAEQDMADYINANVPADDVIFTDDAQSLGVMLLTRPSGSVLRPDRQGRRALVRATRRPLGPGRLLPRLDQRALPPALHGPRPRALHGDPLEQRFPDSRSCSRRRGTP